MLIWIPNSASLATQLNWWSPLVFQSHQQALTQVRLHSVNLVMMIRLLVEQSQAKQGHQITFWISSLHPDCPFSLFQVYHGDDHHSQFLSQQQTPRQLRDFTSWNLRDFLDHLSNDQKDRQDQWRINLLVRSFAHPNCCFSHLHGQLHCWLSSLFQGQWHISRQLKPSSKTADDQRTNN